MIIDIESKNKLLGIVQREIPFTERPFAELGTRIGVSESDVIDTLKELKDEGIIKEVCGVFNSKKFGYVTSLVAMVVEKSKIEEIADLVNSHPGVSHNYLRDHYFNLWFTIVAQSKKLLNKTITKFTRASSINKYMILPSEKEFKIRVNFDWTHSDVLSFEENSVNDSRIEKVNYANEMELNLDKVDKKIIVECQRDLPIEENPFKKISEKIGISTSELFDRIKRYLNSKLMRRYSSLINNRKVGLKANAMTVWKVDAAKLDEVGKKLASYKNVTHCYQRPAYPDWDYSIYTMTHSKNKNEADKLIKAIAQQIGIEDYQILYSTKELKKERVKLFTDEFEKWNAKNLE